MQADDPVLGRLRERWFASWVPGHPVPNDDVPGLHAWVNEWPTLSEKNSVLYRVYRDMVHGHTYQLLVPAVLRTVCYEPCMTNGAIGELVVPMVCSRFVVTGWE